MTDTMHSTTSPLDAVACFLMARVVQQAHPELREIFWETLPDRIPDLEAHLPALIFAVRNESNGEVRDRLSSHPLPATFSPKAMAWRSELVTVLEKRLKAERDLMDRECMDYRVWFLGSQYVHSLRGLTRVDRCGVPSGVTCSSVLPTLLNEARYLWNLSMGMPKLIHTPIYKCLAALAEWRPAPNVMTDPAVLKAWGESWLELHREMEGYQMRQEDHTGGYVSCILKGVAAKALLNLMETRGEEETGIPVGMESLLLESLMQAVTVFAMGLDMGMEGSYHYSLYHFSWLSWQPQDATRFPVDRLAELPKILLRIFNFSCHNVFQHNCIKRVMQPFLTELIRWDTAGHLAACGIDLLPSVVTGLNDFLDLSESFLNHEVCRGLVRHKVANIEGGRELLQKLENHWQSRCQSKDGRWIPRLIAWDGRIQLQRAGLATETVSDFQENLLEAMKNEKFAAIRVVLSIWRPGKDTPDRVRRTWERLWQKGLKSRNEEISRTATLSLLSPDPADDPVDPVARREKLLNILPALPEKPCAKLSIADITNLMGELLPWGPNAAPDAKPNRGWQFRPDEMRFRVPTKPAAPTSTLAPTSTPATVQTASTDRTAKRIGKSEAQLCLF